MHDASNPRYSVVAAACCMLAAGKSDGPHMAGDGFMSWAKSEDKDEGKDNEKRFRLVSQEGQDFADKQTSEKAKLCSSPTGWLPRVSWDMEFFLR